MGSSRSHHEVFIAMVVLVALGLSGCSSSDASEAETKSIRVVATTTMLGDVASNVVGGAGTVEVLLPLGADPHDYQASSQQVALIQRADLVLANGLELEEGLEDVLQGAQDDGANVVFVAERLDPIPFDTSDSADEDHGSDDPHVWLDPIRMAEAGRIVAAELAVVAPGEDWVDRAESYASELIAADVAIEEILAVIPAANRKLVTNHSSLGYFADRYGFEIVGTVVPGGSTLSDPSSAELAALVEALNQEGVRAIFAETTEPAALAEAVAEEAGETISVVDLYTGSLGETGSGAETLVGMLYTNARRIAEALS
jgi:zinc/manganese transport system substrate-binding protein